MAELERSYAERVHWLVAIRRDPSLAPFRDHPKFDDLKRRVGI